MLPLMAPSKGGTSERLIKNPASVLQPACLFSEKTALWGSCAGRKLLRAMGWAVTERVGQAHDHQFEQKNAQKAAHM